MPPRMGVVVVYKCHPAGASSSERFLTHRALNSPPGGDNPRKDLPRDPPYLTEAVVAPRIGRKEQMRMQDLVNGVDFRHWRREGCPHVTQNLVAAGPQLSGLVMGRPPVWRRWWGSHPLSGCRFSRLPFSPSGSAFTRPRPLARGEPSPIIDVGSIPICLAAQDVVVVQLVQLLGGRSRHGCRLHRGCALMLVVGLNQTAVSKEGKLLLRTTLNRKLAWLQAFRVPLPLPSRMAWASGRGVTLTCPCCRFLH